MSNVQRGKSEAGKVSAEWAVSGPSLLVRTCPYQNTEADIPLGLCTRTLSGPHEGHFPDIICGRSRPLGGAPRGLAFCLLRTSISVAINIAWLAAVRCRRCWKTIRQLRKLSQFSFRCARVSCISIHTILTKKSAGVSLVLGCHSTVYVSNRRKPGGWQQPPIFALLQGSKP